MILGKGSAPAKKQERSRFDRISFLWLSPLRRAHATVCHWWGGSEKIQKGIFARLLNFLAQPRPPTLGRSREQNRRQPRGSCTQPFRTLGRGLVNKYQ